MRVSMSELVLVMDDPSARAVGGHGVESFRARSLANELLWATDDRNVHQLLDANASFRVESLKYAKLLMMSAEHTSKSS